MLSTAAAAAADAAAATTALRAAACLLAVYCLLLLRFVPLPAALSPAVLPLSLLLQRAICDFSSATIVATPVTTCVSQTCAFAVCVGGLACWLVLAGCGPGTL